MASQAQIGWGTLFQTESLDSPNVWTTLAEVSAINPPAPSRDAIDTSFGNAPDEWRTSIPGMPGAGEITLEFNFIPSGNSPADYDYYSDLKLELDDRQIRTRRLVFPRGEILEFDAYLTSISSEVSVGDTLKATAKFQVTGQIGPIV